MAEKTLPLVYSCSGCSSAAQLANAIALRLDREGAAEMSCIAGVGGGVAPLVRLAQSGRTIIAIDGCPLACARECLAKQGVAPRHHLLLNELGVRKKMHADFDPADVDRLACQAASLLEILTD
ncbi:MULTISPECIES: putative zinc-binding protein [unclassified Duganella]|uniref:putative zinc-binding protein n=1 Tax=unclassified Duganella TaxID=2636909 RepID=UPI0006F7C762|nr:MULTISPECIES: putative zinc-binding protein [unclassified Duganella]KQV42967.1 zinc-binding protein [Duganella sp. Root336D2]KRB97094.1 zinc-binding protein [Duganella sp. Root198D2]